MPDATTRAKATMHLTITRANGVVEELDVPVTTDLSKDQVRDLIAQHDARVAELCGEPATAAVEFGAKFVPVCEAHLAAVRERLPGVAARAASGFCGWPKGGA
jgi:hypothetical protein